MGSLIKEKKKRISENTFSQFIIFIETKMAATFPKSSLFTIDPSSSQIVSLYSSLRGIFFYRGEMGSASRRTLRLPRDSSLSLPSPLYSLTINSRLSILPFVTSRLASDSRSLYPRYRECTYNHVLTRCLIVSLIRSMILLSQLPFSLSLSFFSVSISLLLRLLLRFSGSI